jgi:cytochrome c
VAQPASFAICGACHATKADSPPGIGPNLFNIAGKKAGSVDGDFDYSDALKASGKMWTPENLEAFIRAPATAVPGNKMDFPGSPDAKAIAAYVGSLK